MSVSGSTLTVAPTISSQIATYNMRVTQSTTITSDFYWIGAIVEVTCTITSISVPDLPTVTEYLIDSGDTVITLTPNFLQYPPCDYPLDELMIWSFDPSPAPVVPTADNAYEITINTNDLSKARMQTLTLTNTITYAPAG